MAVFGYLAARFDCPDVPGCPAAEVLPRWVALVTAGRAGRSPYALIPLLLVPAGAGAAPALRDAIQAARESVQSRQGIFAAMAGTWVRFTVFRDGAVWRADSTAASSIEYFPLRAHTVTSRP